MYLVLGESCADGPCPTLYVDDQDGTVLAQGYTMNPPFRIPPGEDVVRIPADAWDRLLSDLPVGMLVKALWRRLRPGSAARSAPVSR